MWLSNGQLMHLFSGHGSPVLSGTFTPDGKKIVSADEDATIIVWDPKTGQPLVRLTGKLIKNWKIYFHYE